MLIKLIIKYYQSLGVVMFICMNNCPRARGTTCADDTLINILL